MPELLLVRHAEPERKGVLLGRLDPVLSAAGHQRAARTMPELRAAAAYVSPLRRAQQTASYLAAGIPRVTLPDLAEVGLGDWEGLLWEDVELQWPELSRRKIERWFDVPAPGGEGWAEVHARARRVLEIVRSGPAPAIVVAHLGINAMLLHCVTGRDPQSHCQDYCDVVELTY
jgi:broad specificity phosphatase PhoE